jgi:hypothetical protein
LSGIATGTFTIKFNPFGTPYNFGGWGFGPNNTDFPAVTFNGGGAYLEFDLFCNPGTPFSISVNVRFWSGPPLSPPVQGYTPDAVVISTVTCGPFAGTAVIPIYAAGAPPIFLGNLDVVFSCA